MTPELLKNEPVLTQKQKDELNMVARLLAKKWATKSEIQTMLGGCNERTARDYISTIAKKVPVISISDDKGYKRAMTKEDLELAIRSRDELRSRINQLKLRLEPLEKFINYYAINERQML